MLSRHLEQCDAKIQVETNSRDMNQNFAAKSYDKHSILSKPCFQDEQQSYELNINNPQIVHRTAPQLTSHILPQSQNDTVAASRCIVDTNLGIHNFNPYFTNLALRTRDYRRTLFHRLLWNNSYVNDISSMTLLTSRLDPIGLQSLEAECQLRANRQLLTPRLVPLVTRDMTPQDSIDMSTTLGMEHFSITNGQIPVNMNYCGPTSIRKESFNRHCDSFPDILHRLLIDLECIPGGCDIAQFLPTGTGFILKDLQRFVTDILKIYFPRMSSFGSFQRQLNLYDFQRIQSTTSRGVYYHPGFSRTLPLLCVRRKLKRTIKR
jgi:HSF-type DNA-binding